MRRLAVLAAAVLFVGVSGPASAQEPSLQLRLESFDMRQHPHVQLVVSMPPALVGVDVPASAFTIAEDGREVDATFARVPTEGLNVVLLIDSSGSMKGTPLTRAREAAAAFIATMPPEVNVAAVAFGEQPDIIAGFTTDHESVTAALADVAARGETALYDGLVAATALFDETDVARRVLIMLSDGGDTVSEGTLEDAIVALLGARAQFFAVELQSPENDHEPLERLGAATEGAVVPAGDPEALDGIFTEIAASIVNQYEITFEAAGYGLTELAVTVTAEGVTADLVRVLRFPPSPPALIVEPIAPPPTSAPAPVVAAPEPSPAPPPPPLTSYRVEAGPLSSRNVLIGGLVMVFLALVGLSFYAARGGSRVRLAATDAKSLVQTQNLSLVTSLTERVARVAERTLERQGRKGQLERALEAAGVTLRPGEFVVLLIGAALASFVSASFFFAPSFSLLLASIAVSGAFVWLKRKATKRRAAFADQLLGVLQLMSGSLRAGFGLLQTVDVVAEEVRSPAADEFHRVKVETHLGRDLTDALKAMAERVGGDDFIWVVEGIEIHREIGGDLSEIIDQVAETIRERNRLRRQVKALSAEGRISAAILVALPLVMTGFLSIANPSYLGELTNNTGGRVALAIGVGLMIVGIAWMRRLIQLKY